MKGNNKLLILVLSAAGLFAFGTAGLGQQAKPKQKPPAQAVQEPEPEYTEEEFDAYEKAKDEPDLDKRATMLLAFLEKYPNSKLKIYIVTAYQTLLYDHKTNQRFGKLLPLAEQWLKYYPDDIQIFAYIAESANRLGQEQQYIDYALKIYAAKPDCDLAASIANSYEKLKAQDKALEWTQKLYACPAYDGNYKIRYIFVGKYWEAKKGDKAAEYAALTLKSLELAKKPDNQSEADWKTEKNNVTITCNNIMALNYYEKDKFAEAMKILEKVNRIKKDSTAYYYIGRCQWKMDQVDDAILSFAISVRLGGEKGDDAKTQLETLYKAIHNNTLIGIEKIYTKAERVIAGKPPE